MNLQQARDDKPADGTPEASPAPVPKHGYARPPTKSKKPTGHASRSNKEIIEYVEQRHGSVAPEVTMFVLRMYQALELTNRAQREVIAKLGEEIKSLRRKVRGV